MAVTRGSLNKRTACILKALFYLNKSQRKAILKSADRAIITAICECALNIISGNVKISDDKKKYLSKHKNLLRKLAHHKKERSWKQRKQILVQRGSGLLPLMLEPVMSFLLTKLLDKNGAHA